MRLSHNQLSTTNCGFVSFGISMDYSFDTDLADKWACRGFAADSTIVHKSQLHENVTFHNIAASTIKGKLQSKAAKQKWWITTVPSLNKFLNLDKIPILKMDREGCEFAVTRDVLLEEPNFFHSVDQFAFEAHLNILWLHDVEQLYYYAMLFKLLREAGLVLAGSKIGCCRPNEREEVMEKKFERSDILRPGERNYSLVGLIMIASLLEYTSGDTLEALS